MIDTLGFFLDSKQALIGFIVGFGLGFISSPRFFAFAKSLFERQRELERQRKIITKLREKNKSLQERLSAKEQESAELLSAKDKEISALQWRKEHLKWRI